MLYQLIRCIVGIAFIGGGLATGSCRCNVGAESVPMAPTGPEEWVVDGVSYQISSTYYVRRGTEVILYVIEHILPEKTFPFGINDESALKIAFPLMKRAYQSHSYERMRFQALRGTGPAFTSIAVDLVENAEGNSQRYRIVQSVGEIVWRMNGGDRRNPLD